LGGTFLEELKELKERLERQRPAGWDSLPDLSLYMDQLIGYMPRQLIEYGEEDRLTAAMVNNYIKDGLLPRAEGKRYNRTHLAYLTAICAMKQVLPVRDAGLLAQGEDPRETYEGFLRELDQALTAASQRLDTDPADLTALARTLALRSYADKLACQRVIELIRAKDPAPGSEKEKRKKEKKEKKEREHKHE